MGAPGNSLNKRHHRLVSQTRGAGTSLTILPSADFEITGWFVLNFIASPAQNCRLMK